MVFVQTENVPDCSRQSSHCNFRRSSSTFSSPVNITFLGEILQLILTCKNNFTYFIHLCMCINVFDNVHRYILLWSFVCPLFSADKALRSRAKATSCCCVPILTSCEIPAGLPVHQALHLSHLPGEGISFTTFITFTTFTTLTGQLSLLTVVSLLPLVGSTNNTERMDQQVYTPHSQQFSYCRGISRPYPDTRIVIGFI